VRFPIAFVVTALCVGVTAPATAAPLLTITPSDNIVNVGDSFTIDVAITGEDIVDLFAYQFSLTYGAPQVAPVSIVEGDLPQTAALAAGGSTFFSAECFSDADPAACFAATVPPASFLVANFALDSDFVTPLQVTGQGTLFSVTFKALQEGSADFSALFSGYPDGFYTAEFFGNDPTPLALELRGATVRVVQPTGVPEPATLLLIGTGVIGFRQFAKRRART